MHGQIAHVTEEDDVGVGSLPVLTDAADGVVLLEGGISTPNNPAAVHTSTPPEAPGTPTLAQLRHRLVAGVLLQSVHQQLEVLQKEKLLP